MSPAEPAATANVDEYWKSFEINIKGTLLTFQAWQGHMGSHDPTFISLNSTAAQAAFPTLSAYCASKAGQAQMVAAIAAENPNIKVFSMHPGTIESEMNVKAGLPLSKDDTSLPGSFAVWLATSAAAFLHGRFLWAHWDVDELKAMEEDIKEKHELLIGLTGWPKNAGQEKVVAQGRSIRACDRQSQTTSRASGELARI